jgi:hypothetical protein
VGDIQHTIDAPVSVAVLVAIDMNHRAELPNLCLDALATGDAAKIEARMGIPHGPAYCSALLRVPKDKLEARHEVAKRDDRSIIRALHVRLV